uniref:Uncharacterized protein n=1 Tax=viral metagenome TaxID=1070528 RepID=A0A6C0E0Y4_9ZZZZ
MTFEDNESYMHKKAKEVLQEWLKSENGFEDLKTDEKWVGDGVFLEYPLIDINDSLENDTGYKTAFNHFDVTGKSDWYYYNDVCSNWTPPTYEQCVKNGDIPYAILDIAYVYKGRIICGFEICHKNKVSVQKQKKFQTRQGFRNTYIYEIQSSAIMNQTKKPKRILPFCTRL